MVLSRCKYFSLIHIRPRKCLGNVIRSRIHTALGFLICSWFIQQTWYIFACMWLCPYRKTSACDITITTVTHTRIQNNCLCFFSKKEIKKRYLFKWNNEWLKKENAISWALLSTRYKLYDLKIVVHLLILCRNFIIDFIAILYHSFSLWNSVNCTWSSKQNWSPDKYHRSRARSVCENLVLRFDY